MPALPFQPFDPTGELEKRCTNLPHWRQDRTTYFITFRTADSLPRERITRWRLEREEWRRSHPEPHSVDELEEYERRFPARLDGWLDEGHGACPFCDAGLRMLVESVLRAMDGSRYELDAFVVMPNHVHALVTPMAGWELSTILHSWKSISARLVNRALEQSGALWQKESYDHIVRSEISLLHIREYIRNNPHKSRRPS